ncbi:MAG: hypothetical protein UX17_C0014G0005 [Parcubacteria group bacterium GW2011_GWC2_45_7]|nr:MAG: hypothetical protein UX17_C0014G0005 [Parcubacteria group bacterium GW2011_GWC2_45_7]KKU74037.1 MAG: hypothetical protein UX98_C0002G0067 [Parcubacteria group bacterium GW2011_GWA2_47_26]
MNQRLTIHIETTIHHRAFSAWTSVVRRGKFSTETQFFGLFGFNDAELEALSSQDREAANDLFDYALRLATAFEYIPVDRTQAEQFFEKKLAIFENKIKERAHDLPRIHASLGIVSGTQLFFTSSGEIAVLHVSGNAISNFGEMGASGPLHFSNFHNGVLAPHAYLLVVSKHLSPLLKSNDLKEIARSRSSENKLASIRRSIETRNVQPPIFRAVLLEAKPQVLRPTESTGSSIATLLKTEARTEEMLSPPLLKPFLQSIQASVHQTQKTLTVFFDHFNNKFGNKLKTIKNTIAIPIKETRKAIATTAPPIPTTPLKHRTISSYFIRLAKYPQKAAQIIQRTRVSIANTSFRQKILARFARATDMKLLKQKLLFLFRTKVNYLANKFNGLSLKSKIIFIALLTLIFVFSESVLFANRRGIIRSAENQLQTEITGIQTLIDTASASLIYNNEEQARLQIEEAKARLQNLSAFKRQVTANIPLRYLKSAADENETSMLVAALQGVEERLRHIIVIENPTTVLDLRELLPEAKGIFLKDNALFAYSTNALVWSQNNVTQKFTPENITALNVMLAHPQRNALLLINSDRAYIYNYAENKLGEPRTLRSGARDATIYNRRLYTLHPSENQIYKYEPMAQGFNSGAAWIKDRTAINTALALTVDGTAYVLDESGNVTEFRKGLKTNFALKNIDPVLTQATKLWTNEASQYLYILNQSGNRLVVFNKDNGTLKAQYTSQTFTNLKDFAINEGQKIAYILRGADVISFTMPHLKK